MSGSMYSIQPYSRDPAVQMKLSVIGVALNSSATIGVRFFNGSGASVYYSEVLCQGEDYSNWGNDDEYLVNFVCSKLGVIINTPPPEPVVELVVEPVMEPAVEPVVEPVVEPSA